MDEEAWPRGRVTEILHGKFWKLLFARRGSQVPPRDDPHSNKSGSSVKWDCPKSGSKSQKSHRGGVDLQAKPEVFSSLAENQRESHRETGVR